MSMPLTWMSFHLPYWPGSVVFLLSLSTCLLSGFCLHGGLFSGAMTELLLDRSDWTCCQGKIVNMSQQSLACTLSQVINLHFCPPGPLPLVNFLRASISRSQWEWIFFFLRLTILFLYHQTRDSEQSKADFRAVLSKLAWDFSGDRVHCRILGES